MMAYNFDINILRCLVMFLVYYASLRRSFFAPFPFPSGILRSRRLCDMCGVRCGAEMCHTNLIAEMRLANLTPRAARQDEWKERKPLLASFL